MMRYVVKATILGLTGSLFFAGCSPTYRDPQTGVEARYEWETLTAELDLGIREVYPAARDAAEELDLRVMRSHLNGIAAEIRALDAHLDSVDIRLEAMPESRTLLTIRVGTFGNRNKSLVLFEHIAGNLSRDGALAGMDPWQEYERSDGEGRRYGR